MPESQHPGYPPETLPKKSRLRELGREVRRDVLKARDTLRNVVNVRNGLLVLGLLTLLGGMTSSLPTTVSPVEALAQAPATPAVQQVIVVEVLATSTEAPTMTPTLLPTATETKKPTPRPTRTLRPPVATAAEVVKPVGASPTPVEVRTTTTRLDLNNKVTLELDPGHAETIGIAVQAGDNEVVVMSDADLTKESLQILSPDQVDMEKGGVQVVNPKGRGNVCSQLVSNIYKDCRAFWRGGHWGQLKDWGAKVINTLLRRVTVVLQLAGSKASGKNCYSYWEYIRDQLVFWTECQRGLN